MKTVNIKGKAYLTDHPREQVLYSGNWYEIQLDQDGEAYIHTEKGTIYLDKDSQPNEREGEREQ